MMLGRHLRSGGGSGVLEFGHECEGGRSWLCEALGGPVCDRHGWSKGLMCVRCSDRGNET